MRTFPILVALALVLAPVLRPAPASAQQQPDLTPHEQNLVDAYDVMQGVTLGLLGVTAAAGLVQLYNLPTSFGDGACASNSAIFGSYACSGEFSLVHGVLGIASIASYTAWAAVSFAAPDLDDFRGEDGVTTALGIVHGIGIGLTPALGLLAANPGLIGLSGDTAEEFSRHMRVVHWLVALVTVGAFATQLAVDQIN